MEQLTLKTLKSRLSDELNKQVSTDDIITPAKEKTHGFNRVDDSPQITQNPDHRSKYAKRY